MNGWRVFWLLAAIETALFGAGLAAFGTDEAGLRALVRFTVRVSFLVFAVVYAAAPLRRLYPTPATRWLRRNRRYLGVSFAWAHGLHGLAIVLLAQLLGDSFAVDPATRLGGGLAYLLIAAMALTSFDRTARWLGPRRWGLLHRAGLHWLWFIFALNWTASVSVSLAYLPLALITGGLLALRLAAVHARRRGAEPVPEPA
jgi:methionine sulfoxide reductase heme-binding subunit